MGVDSMLNRFDKSKKLDYLVWFLGLAVVSIIFHETMRYGHPIYHDDSFISLTYARHLSRGEGIVFNSGEYIWGYTSPLHVLILGIIGFFFNDIQEAALMLGSVSSGLAAIACFYIVRTFSSQWVAVLSFLLVLTGSYNFWFLGLETNLLILAQLTFILSALISGPLVVGIVGALACLIRPDAVLLCVPVIFMIKRFSPWKAFMYFSIPGVVWVWFSMSYYGAYLPQSFYAKKGLTEFWQFIMVALPGMDKINHIEQESNFALWAGINAIISAGCLLNKKFRRCPVLIYGILIFPWVLVFSYAAIGSPPGHNWEYRSALIFNSLALAVGLIMIIEYLAKVLLDIYERRSVIYKGIFTIMVVVYSMSSLAGHIERIASDQTSYWWGARHSSYLALADWLKTNTKREDKIFYGEPGTIAFFSERFVTDNYLISKVNEQSVDYLVLQGDVGSQRFGDVYFRKIDVIKGIGFEPLSILKR